ncbi:MAG: nucleoside triphosphate pyrophosphohydrolase [Clostridia bacterium]|nr:nucleoside triphosphate pyrophosphohydrolase [Clostridia bacterium]MBQ7121616.1 nucleoside triphosphate pyrophosphohydrolase [Clostridia bacterium]
MVDFKRKESYNVQDLIKIMQILREPGGCPWDAEQTHESIKKNLIEETYEVIEAINKDDKELLCEELGDLLMQVVFHAQMEQEAGVFDFDTVSDGVCKKLIERHPHVFGDVSISGVDDVLTNWDAIKRKTKKQKTTTESMLSVPRELPALMRAAKLQKKAADVGFDWSEVSGALDKLEEEIAELRQAISNNDGENMAEELGDLLFSAVNVSRFIKADAEEALTAASDKFLARFTTVEQLASERGIDMKSAGIDELDRLWDEAKANNN